MIPRPVFPRWHCRWEKKANKKHKLLKCLLREILQLKGYFGGPDDEFPDCPVPTSCYKGTDLLRRLSVGCTDLLRHPIPKLISDSAPLHLWHTFFKWKTSMNRIDTHINSHNNHLQLVRLPAGQKVLPYLPWLVRGRVTKGLFSDLFISQISPLLRLEVEDGN